MEAVYDKNLNKSFKVYEKEQAVCTALFDEHFRPRIEAQNKAKEECKGILKQFLQEQNLSMGEVISYIHFICSEDDLDYMREVYEEVETEEIQKELLRDYYASVLDIESLSQFWK